MKARSREATRIVQQMLSMGICISPTWRVNPRRAGVNKRIASSKTQLTKRNALWQPRRGMFGAISG